MAGRFLLVEQRQLCGHRQDSKLHQGLSSHVWYAGKGDRNLLALKSPFPFPSHGRRPFDTPFHIIFTFPSPLKFGIYTNQALPPSPP